MLGAGGLAVLFALPALDFSAVVEFSAALSQPTNGQTKRAIRMPSFAMTFILTTR